MEREFVTLSKQLSFMLRHDKNTPMDEYGNVKLSYVYDKLNCIRNDIDYIMETTKKETGKERFIIDGDCIRAAYGHSIPNIKIKYKEQQPEVSVLYHGTALKNIPLINKDGIKSMGRQKVCLSLDEETARIVAKRHSRDIYIYKINVEKAISLGVKFYEGNDTTILSDDIPCEALE